jgi:hypothetical protein
MAAFKKASEAPATGGDFKLTDHVDELLLFRPTATKMVPGYNPKTDPEQEIVVADIVVIDEKKPERSEKHEDAWVFQRYIQGSLRGFIEEKGVVLGRLRKNENSEKGKGSIKWELDDYTDEEAELASAYLASANPLEGGAPKEKKDKKKKEK